MMLFKRKKLCLVLLLFLLLCDILIVVAVGGIYDSNMLLSAEISNTTRQNIQISYGLDKGNTADNLIFKDFANIQNEVIELKIPTNIQSLRFDFSDIPNDTVNVDVFTLCVNEECFPLSNAIGNPNITNGLNRIDNVYTVQDADPYLYYEFDSQIIEEFYDSTLQSRLLHSSIYALLFDAIIIIITILGLRSSNVKGLIDNRGTIWNLAKRDFKTRYAGSYLGIFWAFVQPIVTILIYWFVFEVGFKSAPTNGFPFVLWLIAGIVPWFMFSDGITAVTNCLLEYAFLVKKVVFDIKMLPYVKIISALFVHIFFVLFSLLIFTLNGYAPTLYCIQIIYYLFATIMLIIAIGFITSSVIIFFRDLGQIVQIFLQVGVWLTPIMWNLSMLSPKLQMVFKFNPTYYIVEGYRDAFINHVWFWEKPFALIYYWGIVIVILFIGKKVFDRLKVHFADVL